MKLSATKFTLIALILFIPVFELLAASSTTVRVGFEILPFQQLSISGGRSAGNTAVSTVRLPQPSAADLTRGYIELPNAVNLAVRSNIPWAVTVRTDDANMGQSFDGSYTKPVSDFQLRVGNGAYTPISQRNQVLLQGSYGQHNFNVDYRTLFDPSTYRQGNYQVTVIYTIVSR